MFSRGFQPSSKEDFSGGQGQAGFKNDLLLMAIAIILAITGPGRFSIEWDVIKSEIFPRGQGTCPDKRSVSYASDLLHRLGDR